MSNQKVQCQVQRPSGTKCNTSKITSQSALSQYLSDLQVQYDYRYAVDDPVSGVINDRWEHRHGEYVKGAYSVLEPDGRLRIVDYELDGPKGFHAVIRTQFPGKPFQKLHRYIYLPETKNVSSRNLPEYSHSPT